MYCEGMEECLSKPVGVRLALLCRHLVDELRLGARENHPLEGVREERQRRAVRPLEPLRLGLLRAGLRWLDGKPFRSWRGGWERERRYGNGEES